MKKRFASELSKVILGYLMLSVFLFSADLDFKWAFSRSAMLITPIWFLRILFHKDFGIARKNKGFNWLRLIWVPIIGYGLYIYFGAVSSLILENSILLILGIIPGTVLLVYVLLSVVVPLIFGGKWDL